jgi:uncharacterized protein (DUF58 family)
MAGKPVLITDAAPSLADDQARRRRDYLILMVVHIVGFGLSYPLYLWQWWAGVAVVLLTGLLPWVAVLRANAAPRRRVQTLPGSGATAAGSRRRPRPSPSRSGRGRS